MAHHHQKALLLTKAGSIKDHLELSHNYPIPQPKDDEVLVKVHSAAINPVDWKMAKIGFYIKSYPTILGCDLSGTVESFGKNVKNFKQGVAVYGFIKPNVGSGSFQEFIVTPESRLAKKPSNISFEEASTLPVGALTAAKALFYHLKLSYPSEHQSYFQPEYLLVWGGSSSVGAYAVQLGALAGLTVIATASPKNFDYVKSLGATYVFDHSGDVISEVHKVTSGRLNYALDAISSETAEKASKTLSSGGQLAAIAGVPQNPPSHVTVYNVALSEDFSGENDLFKKIYEEFNTILEEKRFLPNVVQVVPKGLAGIVEAFELSASGKISGKKLVVNVVETP